MSGASGTQTVCPGVFKFSQTGNTYISLATDMLVRYFMNYQRRGKMVTACQGLGSKHFREYFPHMAGWATTKGSLSEMAPWNAQQKCRAYCFVSEEDYFLVALAQETPLLLIEKLGQVWKPQEMKRTQVEMPWFCQRWDSPILRTSPGVDSGKLKKWVCVQLNDGLKDVHALISRTWEHYLTGKKKKKGLYRCNQVKDHEMGR